MRLGVVSDTHGLVRPGLLELFRGVDAILHAGDVGGGHVLEALEKIAPTHTVRGNVDGPELSERLELEFGGWRVGLAHGHLFAAQGRAAALVAAFPDAAFIVYGHTHRSARDVTGGKVILNPGSAGPRRFSLPVTAAILDLHTRGWGWDVRTLA